MLQAPSVTSKFTVGFGVLVTRYVSGTANSQPVSLSTIINSYSLTSETTCGRVIVPCMPEPATRVSD